MLIKCILPHCLIGKGPSALVISIKQDIHNLHASGIADSVDLLDTELAFQKAIQMLEEKKTIRKNAFFSLLCPHKFGVPSVCVLKKWLEGHVWTRFQVVPFFLTPYGWRAPNFRGRDSGKRLSVQAESRNSRREL